MHRAPGLTDRDGIKPVIAAVNGIAHGGGFGVATIHAHSSREQPSTGHISKSLTRAGGAPPLLCAQRPRWPVILSSAAMTRTLRW